MINKMDSLSIKIDQEMNILKKWEKGVHLKILQSNKTLANLKIP
jgi:hypothetical protein